jgi:hypothetical protein
MRESRMEFANVNKLYRKFVGSPTIAFMRT